jgi:hypothetical protein
MAKIRDYKVTDVVSASTNPSAQVEYPIHATDDIILLFLAVDGNNTPSLPTGYTNIQNDFGTAECYRLCYKLATSAAEVCPTLSLSAADEWHITVIAISGADTLDPIGTTAQRTANDAASPFTWAHGASTDETNSLVFQFIASDTGLAMMANPPWTNLQCGDAGSAGGSVAYTFITTVTTIPVCDWRGRADDSTIACLVCINDDGNGTRPGYADQTSVGRLVHLLHGGTNESTTYPVALTLPFVAIRNFTQVWSDDAGTPTDETTDLLDAGTADVTIVNTVANLWYFGYDYSFRSMILTISTASVGGTIVWEYWNGSAWTTFTMTGVLTATGNVRFSWAALSGWVTYSVHGTSKFYIRMRISVIFTTAPILSEGHVGGYLTTYDAVAASGDSGINPYQDAMSLSPGSTANYSGSEIQFGSAQDLDTGVLILHHRGVLPRDYAVDPYVNDVTYPVTSILNGRGGFAVVLMDANNDVEAYSIHGKGAISNTIMGWNVAAIGINNGAEPLGQFREALDKSAITRMLFLPQGGNGAMLAHVVQLSIVSILVISGGNANIPMDNDDLVFVANNAFGKTLLFNGIGTYYRVYAPMQIGGGDPINIQVDGITYAMPTTYDGKKYFDWNADDNVAGWLFYGKTGDIITFTNCIWSGTQPYRWEFHTSHVTGTANFTGSQVIKATVTLRSTSDLDGVSFKECPVFTQNAATLTNCIFTDTKIASSSPADAALISDCAFIKTTGTQHAIEISGTAANLTLDGNTFTGYAASDGITGNEAIYVNIATGNMTITITGGGSTPSIRTAGATVTVSNPKTLTLTGLIDGSDISILTAGTTTERVNVQGNSGTTYQHQYTYSASDYIDIGVFKEGYVPYYIRNYTLANADASLPVSQVVDRAYLP